MPYRPSALLASAALTLGVALVPAGAYADTAPADTSATDPAPAFTTADLVTALTAAEAPSAAAGKAGWMVQITDREKGSAPVAMKAIYAVDRGRLDTDPVGTILEAQHAGTYLSLGTLGPAKRSKKALTAVKKSHATWVFMRDPRLDLRDATSDSAIASIAPNQVLAQMVDPAQTTLTGTPTRTVATDGSTTYAFTDNDLTTGGGEIDTVTLTISAGDVLTAMTSVSASESATGTYTYGPQQVPLPSAAHTISLRLFTEGHFLATLSHQIKGAATQLAKGLTRRAHGHAVKEATIRTAVQRFASYSNRALGEKVIGIEPTAGGARITGTNRYLHEHVSYTVTANGTKAVVRKA